MSDTPWQDVLDTAPDAMLLVGPQGRIGMANRQLETMFGYDRGELIGRRVEVLVPDRFREVHRDHRRSFMQEPNLRAMGHGLELLGVRKDGSELAVEVSLSPIEHEVGLIVSVAVRDATERVETERRLRELDVLKDELLSVVSHELRTPLTAITGFAQLLLSRGDAIVEADRIDMLGRIARNAAEMDRLIGQLLDLSRLDAGHVAVHVTGMPLRGCVVTCVRSLATDVSSRVEVDVADDVRVRADVHALDRVLTNLLTNGAKFSPADTPVRVTACVDGDDVVVTVADEGIGIPADEHDKVFDRFYQLGAAERGPRHGTGIGLSIVRRYVELLGGRVWVDSEPDRGAAFSFTLPRA